MMTRSLIYVNLERGSYKPIVVLDRTEDVMHSTARRQVQETTNKTTQQKLTEITTYREKPLKLPFLFFFESFTVRLGVQNPTWHFLVQTYISARSTLIQISNFHQRNLPLGVKQCLNSLVSRRKGDPVRQWRASRLALIFIQGYWLVGRASDIKCPKQP